MTGKKAFALCFDAGRRLFSTSFVLFVRQREDDSLPWRLGLAVTRRVGPAVWRNRTRRLVREVFRLGREDIPPGRDYVVTVRRGFNPRQPGLGDVCAELLPLLRRPPRAHTAGGASRRRMTKAETCSPSGAQAAARGPGQDPPAVPDASRTCPARKNTRKLAE
ncbi:MAG: ribonuclease P protein component [Desulfovibrio sp.]|nr:ribonuclease P protein component [Desulfovibrio sp.]